MKILLIDDNYVNSKHIQSIAEYNSYQFLDVAMNFTEALARIESERPEVVILNYSINSEDQIVKYSKKIKSFDFCALVLIMDCHDKISSTSEIAPDGILNVPFCSDTFENTISIALNHFNYVKDLEDKNKSFFSDKVDAESVNLLQSFVHDLSNPLLSLLLRIQKNKEINDNVKEELVANTKAVQLIMESFKSLYRSSSLEKVSVNAIVEKVLILNEYFCKLNNVKLSIETIDKDLFVAESDLLRIFSNMIKNSVDAISGDEKIKDKWIHIKFENTSDYKCTCFFTDSGFGIPSSIVDNMFNYKFTTKRNSGGSGLGLYLAKSSLEKIGGEIEYFQTGKNTEFKLTLPVFKGL